VGSPVVTVQVTNYTHIGSLYPAALYYSRVSGDGISSNATSSSYYTAITFVFTVHCALFDTDEIVVSLPNTVSMPADATLNATNATCKTACEVIVRYDKISDKIVITLDTGSFALSGIHVVCHRLLIDRSYHHTPVT
jgi:hypothetical protein